MSHFSQLRFINAGHFLDHYFLLIFPTAVIAIMADWQLEYGEALAFGTAAVISFALGTPLAGWLGDRWSRRGMMAIFFIGIGFGSILTGLADDPVGLMAGLAAIGFFAAIYHPVGLAMVTDLADRPGRALAVNGVAGNFGLAAAALATGWISDLFSWHTAFIAPGLVSIAVGLFYLATAYRATAAGGGRKGSEAPVTASRSVQIRVIAAIALFALFGGLIFNAVTNSLPKLFEERLTDIASNLSEVGGFTALVFAIAAFAQLPVGVLLDRFGARAILIALFSVELALFLLIANASGVIVLPLAVGLVLMLFAELPVTAWLLGRFVASAWRARAYSAEYMVSLGISSAAIPIIAYLHYNGYGFDNQFLMLAGCVAVALIGAFMLPGRTAIAPATA